MERQEVIMMNQTPKLSYFFATKKDVLIVSLVGPISKDNAVIFDECIREVKKAPARWVVLHFRDVTELDRTQLPALARLQKTIREKPAELKVCAVHPDLREMLFAQGLLREVETYNNMSHALQAIMEEAMDPNRTPQDAKSEVAANASLYVAKKPA